MYNVCTKISSGETNGENSMIWMEYNIMQAGENFRIEGDTPNEVMDKGLYQPGDVFIVNESGWLVKTDNLTKMVLLHENNKSQ